MSALFILKLISLGAYPVLEYFLGKTESGSVIGVVLKSVLAILDSVGIKSNKK